MPDLLEQPARIYPFSNADFARKAGLRSVEARRIRLEQAAQLKPAQDPFAPTVSSTVAALDFAERRLMRVREQLEKLDDIAKNEKDTKRLKELADATTRLSEQERILAGRPLPGSRRPASDRGSARAMIELRPLLADEPAQVQVVAPAGPLGAEYDDPPGYVREAVIEPLTGPVG